MGEFEGGHGELELLAEVSRMLDLVDQLRQAVDRPIVDTPQGPRTHPALIELRMVRVELRRALGQLGLPELHDDGDVLPEGVARLRSIKARKAARARWEKDATGAS